MISHGTLLAEMDLCGIDISVAMGFPWEDPDRCAGHNRYLSTLRSVSGGRIFAFGALPMLDFARVEEHAALIRDLGLSGIGEIALYNGCDPASRENYLRAVMEAAARNSLPVCLHVNEPVGHAYPGKCEMELKMLYDLLRAYPSVTVVLAHWGGGLLFYELMPEVREALRHVYYDTAASPFLYDESIYGIAVRILGSRKVLFGTDYPLIRHSRYLDPLRKLIGSDEDRENILSKNARGILGI